MQDCWLTSCGLAIGTGKRPDAPSAPASPQRQGKKGDRPSGRACLTSSGRGFRKVVRVSAVSERPRHRDSSISGRVPTWRALLRGRGGVDNGIRTVSKMAVSLKAIVVKIGVWGRPVWNQVKSGPPAKTRPWAPPRPAHHIAQSNSSLSSVSGQHTVLTEPISKQQQQKRGGGRDRTAMIEATTPDVAASSVPSPASARVAKGGVRVDRDAFVPSWKP